jgi:hypothetical protein
MVFHNVLSDETITIHEIKLICIVPIKVTLELFGLKGAFDKVDLCEAEAGADRKGLACSYF